MVFLVFSFFFFLLLPNIFVICLLRHGPPRLAFASCRHALSVNRTRKIKESVKCSVKCISRSAS